MRHSPSIAPAGDDQDVYMVEDDLGRLGRVWRETDVVAADWDTVIDDLLTGQYRSPVRVVAFNIAERWSRDVSEDIARELLDRIDLERRDTSVSLQEFLDRHAPERTVQLALPFRAAS